MRIILLESVESLGAIGDVVDVRAGYGRNYLLPQGKAAPANEEQIAAFEERRAELMALEKERMAATAERAGQVRNVLPLVIVANAGPAGKLYGSVGPAEICAGFGEAGVEVLRSEIQMPEGPIKDLGEHAIRLKLHAEVQEEVTVRVVGQAGETEALPGGEPLPEGREDESDEMVRAGGDAEADEAARAAGHAEADQADGAVDAARPEGENGDAGTEGAGLSGEAQAAGTGSGAQEEAADTAGDG